MKANFLARALTAVVAFSTCASAIPAMAEVYAAASKRQLDPGEEPKELIGDLKTLSDSQLTPVGKDIKSILLVTASGESSVIDTSTPPLLGSAACKADTCCVWVYIRRAMVSRFRGPSGRCNRFARAAVRLGFHDAGTWDKNATFGGADGSILLSAGELGQPENRGLQDVAVVYKAWYRYYSKYGVTMADLIQFGANVATVVCPLGPRIKTYVGRKDNSRDNPTRLLPDVFAPADKLIDLFRNKTIDPHGLAALVGAHTTSQQHFVDPNRAGDPQDSTPGVWDVKFYGETVGTAPKRVFRFPSDVVLSQHPKVSDEWQRFINEQNHWNEDYAQEYIRLSLLGVNNINSLKECTKVLPPSTGSWSPREDPNQLQTWLTGGFVQDFALGLENSKLRPTDPKPAPDTTNDPTASDASVQAMERNPESGTVDKSTQQREASAQGKTFVETSNNTPS